MQLKRILFNINWFSKKYSNRKYSQFIIELLADLVESSMITILLYFIVLFSFYFCIILDNIKDPSASVRTNYCIFNQYNHSKDLDYLVSFVDRILAETNHKYFICYRTLFERLKLKSEYYDTKIIDICLFNQNLNPANLENNLFGSVISKNFEEKLKIFEKENKNFSFSYSSIWGMYHLKLKESSLYIYVFVYMPETKYEFESIQRSGILYIQFSYLSKLLAQSESTQLVKTDFSHSFKMPSKIQSYVIDNAKFKIKISNNYILLPDDPYSLLMYMFPYDWFKTYKNCSL